MTDKTCPSCGRSWDATQSVCPVCGDDLRGVVVPEEVSTPANAWLNLIGMLVCSAVLVLFGCMLLAFALHWPKSWATVACIAGGGFFLVIANVLFFMSVRDFKRKMEAPVSE